ncbi:MAG: class I SAM-dependent methyltransferase [Caldilineaceae bacterium]
MQFTLEDMYGDTDIDDAALDALLQRSLNPRPATMLYDKMGALGLGNEHLLLDIGCRDARHTCELVKRYACRAVGIDPVERHIRLCAETIAKFELGDRVSVQQGVVEQLPIEDTSIDFIWCRDVLVHIADLQVAFHECARVLNAGGKMLVYQTFATEMLSTDEAAWLYPRLLVMPQNMSFDAIGQVVEQQGLLISEKDVIGSEWREWWEENGVNTTSKQLLQIARMRRDRANLISKMGEANYEIELANCYWGVYQMLGKLEPTCYVITKP